MEALKKIRVLNANAIKFIAAALMLVDHTGLMLFPKLTIFRIIGRLSMPLFAFAVSEGCRYTKNKIKHLALMLGLGVGCQLVYFFFSGDTYLNILITFSLSIVIIYAMQFFKKCLFSECKLLVKMGAGALFLASGVGAYLFCRFFTVDYGITGVLLPVFASILDFRQIPAPEKLQKFDAIPWRLLCFFIGLLFFLYVRRTNPIAPYTLLSMVFLLLYNGEKGKLKTKYFFYIFYPLHLALLEGIYLLLTLL